MKLALIIVGIIIICYVFMYAFAKTAKRSDNMLEYQYKEYIKTKNMNNINNKGE